MSGEDDMSRNLPLSLWIVCDLRPLGSLVLVASGVSVFLHTSMTLPSACPRASRVLL